MPESLGARVDLIRLREENGWQIDPNELGNADHGQNESKSASTIRIIPPVRLFRKIR